MSDWTKAMRELREANLAADRKSGQTSEDPLGEIRKFLSSAS